MIWQSHILPPPDRAKAGMAGGDRLESALSQEAPIYADKPDQPGIRAKPGRPAVCWRRYRGVQLTNPTNGEPTIYLSNQYR